MSPSERFTHPSIDANADKTAVLPTDNSPDSANIQRGSDAKHGQSEEGDKSKQAPGSESNKDGPAVKAPGGSSSNRDNKR